MYSDDIRFPRADLRAAYADAPAALSRGGPVSPATLAAFDAIERDVGRTFAGTGVFDSQAARDKLRRVLAA